MKIKAEYLREEHLESLEDEEEEVATERKRDYTNLRLNLGDRDEGVAWHVLALLMTSEACWEEEM